MSATARLNLPYIAPLQAQKQVSYNEAMAALDQLVQPVVRSRNTATPPPDPATGDTYIVGPGAGAAWAGRDGLLASWRDGGWSFRTPAEGWLAYVADAAEIAICAGDGSWASFVTTGGAGLAKLGVNTAADLANRLSVAAAGTLLSHDGADHRLVVNKATSGDTGSLVYQTDFSGRAEIGLAGDDALHVKLSADGAGWVEALHLAPDGRVGLPQGQLAFPAIANPSGDDHTLDDYAEGNWTPVLNFGGGASGIAYGAPTLGRYTKIGRTVFATGSVVLTAKGSATGAATISGLPFPSAADGIYAVASVGFAYGLTGVAGAVTSIVPPAGTRFNLYHANNGAGTVLTHAHFTASAQLFVSVAYEV